jgi:hypothetical protein
MRKESRRGTCRRKVQAEPLGLGKHQVHGPYAKAVNEKGLKGCQTRIGFTFSLFYQVKILCGLEGGRLMRDDLSLTMGRLFAFSEREERRWEKRGSGGDEAKWTWGFRFSPHFYPWARASYLLGGRYRG